CSVIISRDRGKTADYIDLLASEMALVGPLYSKKRKVVQLHFGGGSPSNLTPSQNRLLFSHINKWFDVDYSQGEISVEIDPRDTHPMNIWPQSGSWGLTGSAWVFRILTPRSNWLSIGFSL
ncbi:Oxygen-independent coproporphyrinogen III oxidase, partial [mine drainage metagenome]